MAVILFRQLSAEIQFVSSMLATGKTISSSQNFQNFKPEIVSDMIINEVCQLTQIDYEALVSRCRKREIVIARQLAMWLMCKHTTLSLSAIAGLLGLKNHTTVIHGRETIDDLIWQNDKAGRTAKYLDAEIYQIIYANSPE